MLKGCALVHVDVGMWVQGTWVVPRSPPRSEETGVGSGEATLSSYFHPRPLVNFHSSILLGHQLPLKAHNELLLSSYIKH